LERSLRRDNSRSKTRIIVIYAQIHINPNNTAYVSVGDALAIVLNL